MWETTSCNVFRVQNYCRTLFLKLSFQVRNPRPQEERLEALEGQIARLEERVEKLEQRCQQVPPSSDTGDENIHR